MKRGQEDYSDIFEYYDGNEISANAFKIVCSGDVDAAKKLCEEESYIIMLNRLTESERSGKISYLTSCAVHYAAALQGGLGSSDSLALLAGFIRREAYMKTTADYRDAIKEEFLAFAAAVKNSHYQYYSPPIESVLHYVSDHINRPIDLKDLAEYCGYSVSGIQHRFKKEYGISLKQYIKTAKINKACSLLKDSNMKIIEIAYQVGYASESYFCKHFKDVTGITPLRYKVFY